MQNVGSGYAARNYGGGPQNLGVSRGQINDMYLPRLPPQYLNADDEYGDLPARLDRRLPTNFNSCEDGI